MSGNTKPVSPETAMTEHQTYVHGSRREGWWWDCSCGGHKPNAFVFQRDAKSAARYHRLNAKTGKANT